jgi:2-keto-4-pentenoate hydratase/2-oxohepta-3-ene-1,7-dioic acid hydratase in catechol pathway
VRICRVSVDGDLFFGLIEGLSESGEIGEGTLVALLDGHPFGELAPEGRILKASDVRFIAPVLPSKIIAVGRNYAAHAKEMGGEVPVSPMIFLKPSTSVIGPGEPILLPWQSEQVEHEAELAVVIGRLCSDVPVDRVPDVVLGYTCANDSFCPLGPWIVTDLEADAAPIACRVNGEVRQRGSTGDMVFDVAELVSWISSVMTLLPGDVILTGTPAGVGPIRAGDEVSVTIEGVGTLTNPVVDRG